MKQFHYKSRKEYLVQQIERSQAKASYCKVFFSDIFRYRDLLLRHAAKGQFKQSNELFNPSLCLGVRSGAEVDMFRAVFFSPWLRSRFFEQRLINQDVDKLAPAKIRLAHRYEWGVRKPSVHRVSGVELNPDIERPDVWVGSFDKLPTDWTNRFKLLYSNSFDHSQDPEATIAEWKRVAAPGAYVIIPFVANTVPTVSDPLGGLTIARMTELWQAELVFASETLNRNGYHEVCFRV